MSISNISSAYSILDTVEQCNSDRRVVLARYIGQGYKTSSFLLDVIEKNDIVVFVKLAPSSETAILYKPFSISLIQKLSHTVEEYCTYANNPAESCCYCFSSVGDQEIIQFEPNSKYNFHRDCYIEFINSLKCVLEEPNGLIASHTI